MTDPIAIPSARRAGRPFRRDADELTDRILAEAERLFIRFGFAGTSIESVAAASETTRRSVQHRFEDKDKLFEAVVERHASKFTDLVAAARVVEGEPMDRLLALCRNLFKFALTEDSVLFFRHCQGEAARFPYLVARLSELGDKLEHDIAGVILDAQREGKFRHFNAATLATAIVGTLLSNPINRAKMGDPAFLEDRGKELYFSQCWALFASMA